MLYPIVFIIGFLLSGIWFSFHIYVSQKLKNTKKALMFSPLLTAIIPTIIIWLLIGDQWQTITERQIPVFRTSDLTDQENPISDQCGQKWDFKVHAKNDCKRTHLGWEWYYPTRWMFPSSVTKIASISSSDLISFDPSSRPSAKQVVLKASPSTEASEMIVTCCRWVS